MYASSEAADLLTPFGYMDVWTVYLWAWEGVGKGAGFGVGRRPSFTRWTCKTR